jgi:DHHC palmitoyltransferase
MMSSQPPTPTRIRQRIGSDLPYRDNPLGTPQWGSYTQGGLGPPLLLSPPEKSKTLSCWKRSCCCRPATPSTTMIMMDDGIHYEDDFNDMSWSCSVGTSDDDGVWMNRADPAGTLMSACVWILFLYSAFTMSFLARTNGIPYMASYVYSLVVSLALACHVKTSLTDPGSVPASAVPTEEHRRTNAKLSMCTQCQSFKPPLSHHCRICNRCISRMDHHCPWMNNCTLIFLCGSD